MKQTTLTDMIIREFEQSIISPKLIEDINGKMCKVVLSREYDSIRKMVEYKAQIYGVKISASSIDKITKKIFKSVSYLSK